MARAAGWWFPTAARLFLLTGPRELDAVYHRHNRYAVDGELCRQRVLCGGRFRNTLLLPGRGYVDAAYYIPGSNPTLEDFFRVDYGNGALVVCSTVPFNDGNPNNTGFSLEYSSDSGVAGPWEVRLPLIPAAPSNTSKAGSTGTGPTGSYSSDARNWKPLSDADFFNDIFADSSLVYIVTPGSSFGAVLSSPDGINFGSPVNFPIYLNGGYYARGHYFVWLKDALESTDAINWSVMGSYGPIRRLQRRHLCQSQP